MSLRHQKRRRVVLVTRMSTCTDSPPTRTPRTMIWMSMKELTSMWALSLLLPETMRP
jgi:hypothetical protein